MTGRLQRDASLEGCEFAVNLCDADVTRPWSCAPREGALRVLAQACEESGACGVERIYAGSYFCDRFFLGLGAGLFRELGALARETEMRVTLVVPLFGQRTLEAGLAHADEALAALGDACDEICVNDYGVARRFAAGGAGEGRDLVWGRLFCRSMRDPRYRLFEESPQPLSIDAPQADALAAEFDVKMVEADPFAPTIDASSLCGRLPLALHLPHSLITTGHICEAASARRATPERFRAGAACARECLDGIEVHEAADEWGEAVYFTKQGRTVYFENPACRVIGGRVARVVWTPQDFLCPIVDAAAEGGWR